MANVRLDEPPSQTLMLGNAVHAALYLFFGLKPEVREPVEERLHQCLRSVWRQHRTRDLFANREEERACGEKGKELLSTFARGFGCDVEPVARERWLNLRLANGVLLRGKADRIDGEVHAHRKATLEVIDYKTGQQMLDDDEVGEEPAALIYLLAVEDMYKREVSRVRYLYLAHGVDARWEPEREDIRAARQRLLDQTDEMLADQVFETRPGAHCVHCPFAFVCPEAGRVELTDLEVTGEELVF